MEKKCATCEKHKHISHFGKDRHAPDGRTYSCKKCRRDAANEKARLTPNYYKHRNEKTKEYRRRYYKNPEVQRRLRNQQLVAAFGITIDDYEALLKEQNGVCAICGGYNKSRRCENLAVDHCHDTGKVRGLLCDSCNRGIGFFMERIQSLESAALYLKRHSCDAKRIA